MSGKVNLHFKVSDNGSPPSASRKLPTPPMTPRPARPLPRPPSIARPLPEPEDGKNMEEEGRSSVDEEEIVRKLSQAQEKWQYLPEELRPQDLGDDRELPEMIVGGVRYHFASLNRQESQLDLRARASAPNAKFVAVQIISGKDLVKKDLFSSDPYVKIGLMDDESLDHFMTAEEEIGRTPILKKTLNPVFPPQKWIIDPYKNGVLQNVVFEVWDWDLATQDDFMGRCVVNLDRADQLKTILGCVQILNTFVLTRDGLNIKDEVGGCLKMAIAWARDGPEEQLKEQQRRMSGLPQGLGPRPSASPVLNPRMSLSLNS